MSYVQPYINYVMFPLSIIGITIRAFDWSRTTNAVFRSMWIPGFVYGICIHLSSNQEFYVISSAMVVSAVASVIMLVVMYSEGSAANHYASARGLCHWVFAGIACFSIVLQIGLLFDLRYSSVFWEDGMGSQTSLANEGPEKGILMTEDKLLTYTSHLKDIEELVGVMPNGGLLNFSTNTWIYLMVPYENSSYSAWLSGLTDASVQRLEVYYEMNPGKRPNIVYLEDPADEERVACLISEYRSISFESGRKALVTL